METPAPRGADKGSNVYEYSNFRDEEREGDTLKVNKGYCNYLF